MVEHLDGHIHCKETGHHICEGPNGSTCLECNKPAGTIYGPYWCPDHDSQRIHNLLNDLRTIRNGLEEKGQL